MAEPELPTKPVKKGGTAKTLLIVAAFAVGAAAGGGGAVMAVMQLGGLPGASKAKDAAKDDAASGKLDYVELDNAFTSNLVDTGRYLQLRIAVSTTGGPAVTAALVKHKLAIVSSVLSVLGEMGESDIANRAAKDKLRTQVRAAINDVLRRKAGTSGVDEVYFTSLVVQ